MDEHDNHKIIVYRGWVVKYQRNWMCICGTLMQELVMGPALYREFKAHVEEKEGVDVNA